jgi:hypothetical protein
MHWRLEIAGVLTRVRQPPDFQRQGPLLSAYDISKVGLGHLHFAAGHARVLPLSDREDRHIYQPSV